jgi:hypothetical protein
MAAMMTYYYYKFCYFGDFSDEGETFIDIYILKIMENSSGTGKAIQFCKLTCEMYVVMCLVVLKLARPS